MPIAVVALGGHVLLPMGQRPTMARQFSRTSQAIRCILPLLHMSWRLIISHGNGPQVGHILIRAEAARKQAYSVPLSVAVAQSQGEIGYVIQQALHHVHSKLDLRQTDSRGGPSYGYRVAVGEAPQ